MGKYTGNLVNATDAAVVAWLTSHEDELDAPPPQKTETESQAPRSSPAELTPETIDKMPFSYSTKEKLLSEMGYRTTAEIQFDIDAGYSIRTCQSQE